MPIEIPEISELRGKKAIEALSDAITEFEEQKGNQLTDKQTEALIKIAKAMISSLQGEKREPNPRNEQAGYHS